MKKLTQTLIGYLTMTDAEIAKTMSVSEAEAVDIRDGWYEQAIIEAEGMGILSQDEIDAACSEADAVAYEINNKRRI